MTAIFFSFFLRMFYAECRNERKIVVVESKKIEYCCIDGKNGNGWHFKRNNNTSKRSRDEKTTPKKVDFLEHQLIRVVVSQTPDILTKLVFLVLCCDVPICT